MGYVSGRGRHVRRGWELWQWAGGTRVEVLWVVHGEKAAPACARSYQSWVSIQLAPREVCFDTYRLLDCFKVQSYLFCLSRSRNPGSGRNWGSGDILLFYFFFIFYSPPFFELSAISLGRERVRGVEKKAGSDFWDSLSLEFTDQYRKLQVLKLILSLTESIQGTWVTRMTCDCFCGGRGV
jgi:hypothetical protein